MYISQVLAVVATCLIGQSAAAPIGPTVVHPGNSQDLVITDDNTVNGTAPSNMTTISNVITLSNSTTSSKTTSTTKLEGSFKAEAVDAASDTLPLSFYNNLGPNANAYITGKDINNNVVILQPNGAFFYPSTTSASPVEVTQDIAIPLGAEGSTTSITIPAYLSAARVWFADGNLHFFILYDGSATQLVEPSAVNPSDPSADVNWGFVELTWNNSGVFANISYVDFVGLPLGMSLTDTVGGIQEAKGLAAGSAQNVCNDLIAQQAIDGAPWSSLCEINANGTSLRVLAPIDWISITPGGFGDYWTDYINQVWDQYTSSPLTIDTQEAAGQINCQVSNGNLTCDGDNRSYAQPNAGDIFGCNSGPFAIIDTDNDVHRAVVPRLCAAFNRSTLMMSGGNVQPSLASTSYYTASPTNHYSRIVHQYEVAGTGYAFSYDDVNPSGENQSGAVSCGDPAILAITVGGPQ